MYLPIYQVDAFTGRLFSGNPAAVILPESALSVEIMQAIAAENNLSETAFVMPEGDHHRIRWFTPAVEVDLCGHATLAAAHVLFSHLGYRAESISFTSPSGMLHVRKQEDLLFLNFPADTLHPVEPAPELIDGLGTRPVKVHKGRDDYLALLESEDKVRSLAPDMSVLEKTPSRGVIITAPGRDVDFVSRFFAPQLGVPEDPVTGSSHTSLIPYWAARLGKQELHALQVSKRGGEIFCKDLGERVEIGGRAVTYLVGKVWV